MADLPGERAAFDVSVSHPARRYNYWLGGKDNFAADRASGDAIEKAYPTIRTAALENRAFLRRAVRFAAHNGVRQFIDIGTGLPVPDNTHEVAQQIIPQARVMYTDNDPLVLSHARALLVGDPRGRTAYLEADVRDPDDILHHPSLRETLDLEEPVGLCLLAVLHFVHDDAEVTAIVRRYLDALAPGSYLIASHATVDFSTAEHAAAYHAMYAAGKMDAKVRTAAQFTALFDGLQIVEPGVVPVSEWRADNEPQPRPSAAQVGIYGAVGRTP